MSYTTMTFIIKYVTLFIQISIILCSSDGYKCLAGVSFERTFVCSGALVHVDWVVTAARCFDKSRERHKYHVYIGWNEISGSNRHQQYRGVDHIEIHPFYSKSKLEYDVAMLKVRVSFALSYYVKPGKIPLGAFSTHGACYTFGLTNDSKDVHRMKEVETRVLAIGDCYIASRSFKKSLKEFVASGINYCLKPYYDIDWWQPYDSVKHYLGNIGSPSICYNYIQGITISFRRAHRRIIPIDLSNHYKWIEYVLDNMNRKYTGKGARKETEVIHTFCISAINIVALKLLTFLP